MFVRSVRRLVCAHVRTFGRTDSIRFCSRVKNEPSSVPPAQSSAPSVGSEGGYAGARRAAQKDRSFLWSRRNTDQASFAEHVMREAALQEKQFELKTKSPRDSYRSYVLPFGSNPALRDQYINAYGGLRFGKILEDLDAFAAECAYVHADGLDPQRPVTIVTASCDRIDLLSTLSSDKDLIMEGCVTYVGRSSMVVRIEVSSLPSPTVEEPLLVAAFTLVAKDRVSQKAAPVHKMEPRSTKEQDLFEWGKAHSQREKAEKDTNMFINPPSPADSAILHSLFMQRSLPNRITLASGETGGAVVAMENTSFELTHIMMPQEKNIHNKIFGGFLMRKAYELGWSTAMLFSGERPVCRASDHIEFRKPVPIGSVVIFQSVVSYVSDDTLQVMVEADVIDTPTGTRDTTNVFSFTYGVPRPLTRTVQPRTYREGVIYLQGRKAHERAMFHRSSPPAMMFTGPLDV